MFEAIRKFKDMPGGWQTVNFFDAFYSSVATSLVYSLGGAGKLLGLNKTWKPGEKLQILFLAYSGARNTGAEVRVAECIRQVNQILGEENIVINMTTLDLREAGEYFKDYRVTLKEFSSFFFGSVYKYVLENHLVVLVEGSCWKENFASALLLYFLYGAGLARRLGKPAFSYAVDAGKMNKLNNYISWLLSQDTKLITRSEPSNRVLENIGLPGAVNRVDTAWSMPTESPAWAKNKLMELGWDGKKRLAGLAFQNYFWWPVVPNLWKYAKSMVTGDKTNQYKLLYYYDYDREDERQFEAFMDQCVEYVEWMAREYDVQPVIVAMEALDEIACRALIAKLKTPAILISCKEYVGVEIGAILRQLAILTTTRYHAMVLAMPGLVPFIGLSRDERIMGVMQEIGEYDNYYVDYRSRDLTTVLRDKTSRILGSEKEHARFQTVIKKNLPYYYAQMGMLGLDIRNFVKDKFPGFTPIDIDENDLENLVPFVPKPYLAAARKRYLELKKAEARGGK